MEKSQPCREPLPLEATSAQLRSPTSTVKPHLVCRSCSGDALPGLVVERVVEEANAADLHMQKGPSRHVVVIPTRGAARLRWKMDGLSRNAVFAPGEMLINPKDHFVSPNWDQQTEFFLVGFEPAFIETWAEVHEWSRAEIVPRFHLRDGLLEHLVAAFVSEIEQEGASDRVYMESLAHTLAAHLLRKYSVTGRQPRPQQGCLSERKLRKIEGYIHEHLGETIRIADLAQEVGLSPSHFITIFRRTTRQSPHQWLLAMRVAKAKSLLRGGRQSIADIALQTGFADQSHLSRVMRRHTGLTPRMIREG